MLYIEDNKTEDVSFKGLPEYKKLLGLGQIIYTHHPENYNFLGIGTCLGIYMFDLNKRSYIMAHTMLSEFKEEISKMSEDSLARYTDVAIRLMIKKLLKTGSKREDIKCKIAGGAKIYNDSFDIGEKNIEKAKQILREEQIQILAEDTGGSYSRSIIIFHPDGRLQLRKNGQYYEI